MGSNLTTGIRYAVLGALCAAAMLLPVVQAPPALAGAPAIVITPPWFDGHTALLEQSQGYEIAPARSPIAMLVVLEQPQAARAVGAWLVLDAASFPTLCTYLSEK